MKINSATNFNTYFVTFYVLSLVTPTNLSGYNRNLYACKHAIDIGQLLKNNIPFIKRALNEKQGVLFDEKHL